MITIQLTAAATLAEISLAREIIRTVEKHGHSEATRAPIEDTGAVLNVKAPSVDSKGLPWDARIHASTKGVNTDGSWKRRRSVSDGEVATVEAMLRTGALAPTHAEPPPIPPAPPPPATVFQTEVATVQTPPPPPNTTGPVTLGDLIAKITPHITSGKLTQAEVSDACKSIGIVSLPLLATRPDLMPAVGAYIDAIVMTKG